MRTTMRVLVPLIGAAALLLPTTADAQSASEDGFAVITQRTSDRNLQPAYEWFQNTNLLSRFSEVLEGSVELPHQVTLTSRQCGSINAYYQPQSEFGGPAIVMCYELVEDIFDEFRFEGRSAESENRVIVGTVAFVLMHEVGHALIDLQSLPITGREEDVADQFATLMLDSEPTLAIGAAQYFDDAGDFGDLGLSKWNYSPGSFGDEHSLGAQRFYNILCWVYGAEPSEREYVVRKSLLPEDRARRCGSEYRQMSRAFRQIAGEYVDFELAGQSASQEEPATDVTGSWSFSERFSNESNKATCTSSGTIKFSRNIEGQWSADMSQSGSCEFGDQQYDNDGTFAIDRVQVTSDSIGMRAESCVYQGAFSSGGTKILGEVVCGVETEQGTIRMKGIWSASRH